MREILFRGKRIDNGEWVEGFLYITHNGEYEIGRYDPYVNIERITFVVAPATVGQYTGLTDKNGKRIFEGDIVESVFTERPYIVCFGEYPTDGWGGDESACGWYVIGKDGYAAVFGSPDDWATVVGNIHNNPELMEVSE